MAQDQPGHRAQATLPVAPSGTADTLDGAAILAGAARADQQSFNDLIGVILGERYQIVERLGEGGMGVVFKARHSVLGHELAVKLLLKPQEEAAKARFFHEAKLASRLTHPNTVKISDFGLTQDGRPYLVMEFLRGPTLRRVLSSEGALDPLRTCRIALQMARGLHAVHEQGSVHRDLKPENIFLLDQDGQRDFVKIFDFGIAAHSGGGSPGHLDDASAPRRGSRSSVPDLEDEDLARRRMTMPGMLLGTPHYMPPEQADGGDVDARADQYALGCIVYEMLTDDVPFDAPTLKALLRMHVTELAEPPRKRRPGLAISDELEALVMRLLAKDPGARFPSMREVEQALQRQIDALERPAGQPSVPQRSRARWLLAPGLLAVLAGGYIAVRQRTPTQGVQRALSAAELGALRQQALEVLLRDLAAPDRAVRRGALQRLAASREGSSRSAVEALLNEPDAEVRAQAALALGGLGDRAAAARLRPLLDPATPPNVRAAAAGALDQLGDRAGTELLKSALGSSSAELRQRAAYLLCERGEPQAQRVLSALAASARSEEVLPLLGRLAQCGSQDARERLRAELRGAPERSFQAAGMLAQSGDPEGRAQLLALAQRPGPAQLPAARLLATPEDLTLSALFRRILREDHPTAARILALEGLGLGGGRADVPAAAAFLKEPGEPRLRQAAAAAILQIAAREPGAMSEQALAWAREATIDGDWVARRAAAEVLGDSSAPEATSLLSKLLGDGDARVRLGAVRALGRRHDRAALEILRGGLRDSSVEVRRGTLISLAKVAGFLMRGSPRSLVQEVSDWLGGTIQSGTPEEQLLGSALLMTLGDRSQIERLRSFLSAPDESLRLLAVQKSPAEPALLAALLRDSEQAVRFAAAVRLAEASSALSGEQRALVRSLLREGIERGGAEAVTAYGGLLRLGEPGPALGELEAQLRTGDIGARMAAAEACGLLPPRLALPLLRIAAHDPEPLVRQMAVEVAAELADPDGELLRLLRQLAADSDARVRARALLVLSSRAKVGAAEAESARSPHAAESAPPAVLAPPASAPSTAPAADGRAVADGGAPAAAMRTGAAPALPSTPASAPAAAPATAAPPAATRHEIPQVFDKALKAIARNNGERARADLEKATTQCLAGKLPGADCGRLSYEGGAKLAQLYERQGQLGEAMVEYERLQSRAASLKLAPDQTAALAQARKRLEPRVGRIVVPKKTGGKCQEVLMWMKMGTHQIEVDDEVQVVTVRPGETTRVGSCK